MRLACFLFGEVRYGYVHKLCFLLFRFITVALLYQVADAEQKDFFFVFPFHLLPGAVYVEADACRNDGD